MRNRRECAARLLVEDLHERLVLNGEDPGPPVACLRRFGERSESTRAAATQISGSRRGSDVRVSDRVKPDLACRLMAGLSNLLTVRVLLRNTAE